MSGPAASERRLRCHDASLGSPPRTIPRCESLVAVARDGEPGLSLAACRLLLTASNSRPRSKVVKRAVQPRPITDHSRKSTTQILADGDCPGCESLSAQYGLNSFGIGPPARDGVSRQAYGSVDRSAGTPRSGDPVPASWKTSFSFTAGAKLSRTTSGCAHARLDCRDTKANMQTYKKVSFSQLWINPPDYLPKLLMAAPAEGDCHWGMVRINREGKKSASSAT